MGYPRALEEEKMNSHLKNVLNQYKKTMDEKGSDFKDNPKNAPGSNGNPNNNGVMKSHLMNWTTMLENLSEVSEDITEITSDPLNGVMPEETSDVNSDSDDAIMDELNKIFTPILIMQSYESDDMVKEAYSEASVLTEKNIIKFDDETRMSQLISVCALLIEKYKNSPRYQTYQKAATIRNQTKLAIEKDNYDDAKSLAKDYLLKVSTGNNSSIARKAASDLLPATQH